MLIMKEQCILAMKIQKDTSIGIQFSVEFQVKIVPVAKEPSTSFMLK